jgi:hypothetical protein
MRVDYLSCTFTSRKEFHGVIPVLGLFALGGRFLVIESVTHYEEPIAAPCAYASVWAKLGLGSYVYYG